MKIDLFSIGKLVVHGYGAMIGLGILLCVILAMYRANKRMMDQEVVLDIALFGIAGGFLGAKLLYIIIEIKQFIANPLQVLGSEGFVVYGGIIAGVFAAILYCRRKNIVFLEYFDLLVPSVALAQGFGRIGCFLAGCCYGRETTSGFGVIFPASSLAPAGIKLLPTQLLSSAGDFVIMIILLLYARKAKRTGAVGAMYLLLYGIGRFFIEFLRFDERGGIGVFSTSQIISIIVLLLSAAFFLRKGKAETKRS